MTAISDKDLDKYLYCMKEIKLRMDVILRHANKQWSTGFVIPDNEALCIQFRKVLELIALASLAANKEEYAIQNKKFAAHWNARRILNDLEKVNPNFYPLPSRQILDPETGRVTMVDPIESGYLTKEEFIKVYEQIGAALHASNPYGAKRDIEGISAYFPDWFAKIVTLLNHHQVRLFRAGREDYELWVMMDKEGTGQVWGTVVQKIPIEESGAEDPTPRRDAL